MKKTRHVLLFTLVIIIISTITGFIYGINNHYDLTDYIASLTTHNNLFFNNILILFIFLISTLSIFGIIFQILIISIESVSVGYVIAIFFTNFSIKGILYALINIIINKVFFIVVLMYLLLSSYIYVKKSIDNLVGLNRDYFKSIVMPVLYKYLIIFIFIIIYDIIIFFFGNMLLNYLTFLL